MTTTTNAEIGLKPAAQLAEKAKTPFPGASAEYEAARQALLAEEIEFRRRMTRLVAQRQALPPGPVITTDYRFKDEQGFDASLIDLFGDKDTLVTYFWMYGPSASAPAPCAPTGSVRSKATRPTSSSAWPSRSWAARPWNASTPLPRSAAGAT